LSLVQIQEAGHPASFRYLPEHIRPVLVGILGVNRLARAEFENPLPYLDDLFSMADQVHRCDVRPDSRRRDVRSARCQSAFNFGSDATLVQP
jgi:hypothetical protein